MMSKQSSKNKSLNRYTNNISITSSSTPNNTRRSTALLNGIFSFVSPRLSTVKRYTGVGSSVDNKMSINEYESSKGKSKEIDYDTGSFTDWENHKYYCSEDESDSSINTKYNIISKITSKFNRSNTYDKNVKDEVRTKNVAMVNTSGINAPESWWYNLTIINSVHPRNNLPHFQFAITDRPVWLPLDSVNDIC